MLGVPLRHAVAVSARDGRVHDLGGAAALHFKGRLSIKKGTAQVTVTEWVDTTPGASLGTVEGSGAGTLAGKPFKYVAVTVASARTASVPGTVDVLQSQTLPAW